MENQPKYKVIGNSDKYDRHHFPIGTVVWSFPEVETIDCDKTAYTDGDDYWWLPEEDLELIQQ
jgi:hypothetical protein